MVSILPGNILDERQRREALALQFTNQPDDERPEKIESASAALQSGQLDASGLLTAWIGKHLVGVLVVEFMPGSGASYWPHHVEPIAECIAVEDALLSRASDLLRDRRIKVAQSLIPSGGTEIRQALERHGFLYVTRVWRMNADVRAIKIRPIADLQMDAWDSANGSTFLNVLMQTFTGTLDAPELDGTRTPAEVLAGHQASAPDQSRWWLARWKGEPAGVLILAQAGSPEVLDLAYLGVAPAWRGRGIGSAMLSFSLEKTAELGGRAMTLLVDERNWPALELYREAGFQDVDSRDVLLRKLQLT
ncbi:MAG: GNAT family N-acetyltransferase [Planctomycetes bacterium]|nr:GNAT family N-acetyltransferase [Planctomycetota bacterium]